MMLNAVFPIAAKIIEPQAVFIRIIFVKQAKLQTSPLLGIDNAFENRVLYSFVRIPNRFLPPSSIACGLQVWLSPRHS